jgi:branched-chain amino acid transport system substrate-binding protein
MRGLCLVFLFLAFVQGAHAETLPLKIGFILPLSGDLAFLGIGIRNGALLAKEDIEKQGGNVDLVFEDNRGDLATSARLGSRFVNSDRVAAVVSIISGVGAVLKPLAAKAQVLHIGICSDPDVADGRFSFVNYLTAEQGVKRYLEHFRASVGVNKSLAVVQLNEAGFERIVKELQRSIDSNPRIVDLQTFNRGSSDFRSLLLRVGKTKPDALLLLGLSPEIELLARQARTLRISTPLTSIESFGLANDKSSFEGAWFIDSAVPSQEFQGRYAATYGSQVTPGVGHAYDTVRMVYSSFVRGESTARLAERFRSISDFPGVVGRLQVRSQGVVWSEASVKKILGGEVSGVSH